MEKLLLINFLFRFFPIYLNFIYLEMLRIRFGKQFIFKLLLVCFLLVTISVLLEQQHLQKNFYTFGEYARKNEFESLMRHSNEDGMEKKYNITLISPQEVYSTSKCGYDVS